MDPILRLTSLRIRQDEKAKRPVLNSSNTSGAYDDFGFEKVLTHKLGCIDQRWRSFLSPYGDGAARFDDLGLCRIGAMPLGADAERECR